MVEINKKTYFGKFTKEKEAVIRMQKLHGGLGKVTKTPQGIGSKAVER